jgi:hypothetical protein
MTATGVGAWTAVAVLADAPTRIDVLGGLLGPLMVASATWVLMERTYRRRPESLTSTMIAAFGFKLVFFGAYVAAMLGPLALRPVPFVASFTGAFIALHLMEALFLRRLLAGGTRAAGSQTI